MNFQKYSDMQRRHIRIGAIARCTLLLMLAGILFPLLPMLGGCGGGASQSSIEDKGGRKYPVSSLTQLPVVVNGTTLELWIMDTEGKRDEGMMNLTDSQVSADEGMLFVFSDAEVQYFYMKNTPLPLDIAYLDSNGIVVSTYPLTPYDLDGISSLQPAQYAIELKQGTLAQIGLTVGMKVALPNVSAH